MTPQELLQHHDAGTLWPGACDVDVATAYQQALAVRRMRVERGERPRGFKIGFTNRTIWDRYNVHAPIWGTVWDTTLAFCDGRGEVSLERTSQPRLEPEAVFGLRARPPANAGLDELFACLEWVAPGFEVVQSHQPGWKFVVADTAADSGLHGRLLVGPKTAVTIVAPTAAAFEQRLACATVALRHGDRVMDRGIGANVLDGPLHALRHFLQELRACPGAPDLQAGDVVTTGTWTDAWPVAPGESWVGEFDAPLSRLEIRFR